MSTDKRNLGSRTVLKAQLASGLAFRSQKNICSNTHTCGHKRMMFPHATFICLCVNFLSFVNCLFLTIKTIASSIYLYSILCFLFSFSFCPYHEMSSRFSTKQQSKRNQKDLLFIMCADLERMSLKKKHCLLIEINQEHCNS